MPGVWRKWPLKSTNTTRRALSAHMEKNLQPNCLRKLKPRLRTDSQGLEQQLTMTPREKHYFTIANRPLEQDSGMELVLAQSPHLAWGDISLLADHQDQDPKANPRGRKASGEDTADDDDLRWWLFVNRYLHPILRPSHRQGKQCWAMVWQAMNLACRIQYGFRAPTISCNVTFLATGKPKQGQVYSLGRQRRVITFPVPLPGSQSLPIFPDLSNAFTIS